MPKIGPVWFDLSKPESGAREEPVLKEVWGDRGDGWAGLENSGSGAEA